MSFLTPDVMQRLLEIPLIVDIEFSDKSIYFIVEGDVFSGNTVEKFFKSALIIMKEINHKLSTYRPLEAKPILSFNSQPSVSVSRSSFKASGLSRRKKTLITVIVFIVTIFIVYFLILFLNIRSVLNDAGL